MGLDIIHGRILSNKLDPLDCWEVDEECPEIKRKFGNFIHTIYFTYEGTEEKTEVVFYEQIGYQRKGVYAEFYKHYPPDKCLVYKEQILHLYNYILPEYQENFKTEFLDKFVEGNTVVFISW